MSINSQAVSDLKDQGILNDNLPFTIAENSPQTLDVFTTPLSGGSESPLTDEIRKKLLSPKTTFKSISEDVELVSDMETIQKSIAKTNAISFAKAEEVAMTFEGFNKQISTKEFTRSPSQVNFAFTKRYMNDKITLRKENVCTELEKFFSGAVVEAEESFITYKNFHAKNLLGDLELFQQKCVKWLDNKKSISNQIFQTEKDFINFATTAIKDLPPIISDLSEKHEFQTALKNLEKKSSEDFLTNNLIEVIKNFGSLEDLKNIKKTVLSSTVPLSALDFISLFSNIYLREFIIKLEVTAETSLENLTKLKEKNNVSPTDFKEVRNFIVLNGGVINTNSSALRFYFEVIELVKNIFINTSTILDFFTIET